MKRLPHRSIPDHQIEQVRQEHHEAIHELQGLPAAGLRVIADVTLASGVATPVPHGLGRPALWVGVSCVRGPSTVGMVEEVRDGTYDRSKFVTLKASGYGATVTASVVVL